MLLDKISYQSKIKDVNPLVKFFLSFSILIFLAFTKEKNIFITNFILFSLLTLFRVKVKISDLLKLYSIPLVFVFSTVLSLWLIKQDIALFLMRSVSSLSVVYFLICSTPIIDLDYVFYKLKFPKIFREMFILVYRYIFVLFDVKDKMLMSQNSRLGYSNFKNGMKSFPLLAVGILRKSYYYGLNSSKAVESRLGTDFLFLHKKYKKYKKFGIEMIFVIIILGINLFLAVKYYA